MSFLKKLLHIRKNIPIFCTNTTLCGMFCSRFSMTDFISSYPFHPDASKSGRILHTAKIGDVYMYRVVIAPGATGGNYFHKKTSIIYYLEKGKVMSVFEQVHTKQQKTIHLQTCQQAIHIPPYVAHATKNTGKQDALLIMFTSHPVRSGDNYPYQVIQVRQIHD